ncbi:hypothetical protein BCR44DRAFT_1425875, partial [Catenaria anguillulae PL171]
GQLLASGRFGLHSTGVGVHRRVKLLDVERRLRPCSFILPTSSMQLPDPYFEVERVALARGM